MTKLAGRGQNELVKIRKSRIFENPTILYINFYPESIETSIKIVFFYQVSSIWGCFRSIRLKTLCPELVSKSKMVGSRHVTSIQL